MSDHITRYEGLMERFIAWAGTRRDVRAAFIVGSRSRTTSPADEWSDLDVVTFAEHPRLLLDDREWLFHLGDPEISFREPTADGIWEERRVLFANGCDADFSILPAQLIDELERAGTDSVLYQQASNVVARGYRVLVDRRGRLAPLLRTMASAPAATDDVLTQEAFDQLLSNFWYHCVWISRKLRRGELAVAHECLEGTLRQILITLIRWVAARDIDTWHGTRFFEGWAPQPVREHFARTFAQHDAGDLQRALTEMMSLASWLASELADASSLTVGPQAEQSARRWVAEALDT